MAQPPESSRDAAFMRAALREAETARAAGEVPVGAVLVRGEEIIACGANSPIASHDPTAHAEIAALRAGGRVLGSYRLTDTTLYVTLEPCVMCVGAMVHARIGTLVYGAAEPKSGAIVSTVRAADLPGLNHRFEVRGGLRENACRELMQAFFKERR